LSLIHKATSAGHVAYVIDIDKKICKSERTGVWIEGKYFKANEETGQIFIPYISHPSATKIIMIHNHFAQLGEFLRKSEDYSFEAAIHLVSESVLVGSEAQILIRPKLTINGKKASVKMLKNVKIKLTTSDFIKNSRNSKTYEGLKFQDNQETTINFQVAPNLQRI